MAKELGSESITVWLSDGSCFPGQLNFRKAFENTLESLKEVYKSLPEKWKMFVEYKAFEPNFYSMTVGDWGQSLLYANKLGSKAYTLVDLGHHLPHANTLCSATQHHPHQDGRSLHQDQRSVALTFLRRNAPDRNVAMLRL